MSTLTSRSTISAAASTAGLTSIPVPGARETFFASKDEFLAYRAAWRALATATSRPRPHLAVSPLSAEHYAAHALLTGRDLGRAFSPNRRGHGQLTHGALAAAIIGVMTPKCAQGLPPEAGAPMARLRAWLEVQGLRPFDCPATRALAAGSFAFSTEAARG